MDLHPPFLLEQDALVTMPASDQPHSYPLGPSQDRIYQYEGNSNNDDNGGIRRVSDEIVLYLILTTRC